MEDSLDTACLVPDVGDTVLRIHHLKRSAYAAVLRAFCAQSHLLSQANEERLAELRNEFKISDSEHSNYLVKASSSQHIKYLSCSADLYNESVRTTEVMKVSLDHARMIPDAGDIAFQIHCLERSAYASVLRAFCAQSDLLSWLHAKFLAKLRYELNMSETEHREVILMVSSDDYIKSLRHSLANYSGLTKNIPSFDGHAVFPHKIAKTGEIFTPSLNCLNLAQQSPVPADSVSPARNSGMFGTSQSHSTTEIHYLDPHAVVPAKKLKSGNGSALAYFECPPCTEQLPVAVSPLHAESSVDNALDSKTSSCDMKAGCDLSPMLQENHSQSKAGHVPSCIHQDMQASIIMGTEASQMHITKIPSVIIYSAGNMDHGSDIIKIRLTSTLLNKVEKLLRKKPDPANLEIAKSILKDQERQLLDALVQLTELSFAGGHSCSSCQTPDELLKQHDEVDGDEETPPRPVSSSLSNEHAAASTCASNTVEHEEAVETKGRRELTTAAKRTWRPTVRITGSEWVRFLSRKRKKKRMG